MWLRDVVQEQLDALTSVAAFEPSRKQRLHELAAVLSEGALDRPAKPPFAGLSHINADGLPFQWSIAAGNDAPSVRFLCERGPVGATAHERYGATWKSLREACAIAGTGALPSLEWLANEHVVPPRESWPAWWRSAMWTGVGATSHRIGLKAYFNMTAGAPVERWRRVGFLLLDLGRHAGLERLCELSGRVSNESWPVGLAIDMAEDESPGAVRLYFRSGAVGADWLAGWYAHSGYERDKELARLLLETCAPPAASAYPPGAFVISIEFPPSDGQPVLKTEVELGRWIRTEREAVSAVRRLLRGLGVDEDEYLAFHEALGCAGARGTVHRLVGIRSEPSGRLRANIYLEPPLPEAPSALPARSLRAKRIGDGVRAGLEWLQEAGESGGWTDYRLPVGVADRWTTAWVTYILSLVQGRAGGAETLVQQGRDWLEEHRTPGGGWGYNETTADDADSTGLAVLALRSRREPPTGSLSVLRACLRPDGGVATYAPGASPGGAWQESVADVTPVAIEAMAPAAHSPDRLRAIGWMLGQQRPDGLWHSYWWTTPLYPAWWVVHLFGSSLPRVCRDRLKAGLLGWRPAGAFEQALHVLAFADLGLRDEAALTAQLLLDSQEAEGSWAPGALLRLSRPDVKAPWGEIDSGSCYLDERRVFTTVTATVALTRAR